MKYTLAAGACAFALLASATAWGAPQTAAHKPRPVDQIRVFIDTGSEGGEHGGSSETWILRANNTATHEQTFDAFDQADHNAQPIHETGTLAPNDYAQFLGFLTWSHLLTLRCYNLNMGHVMTVSLTRRGVAKSVDINGESDTASSAQWSTLTLVQALVAHVAWKKAP